jgi:hypothetical protein
MNFLLRQRLSAFPRLARGRSGAGAGGLWYAEPPVPVPHKPWRLRPSWGSASSMTGELSFETSLCGAFLVRLKTASIDGCRANLPG